MFDINDKRLQETTWTGNSQQLDILLSYLPDVTPCCLASISRKPCIEVRVAIQLVCNSEFLMNHRFSYTESYYYYLMKLLEQMKGPRPKIPYCGSFSFPYASHSNIYCFVFGCSTDPPCSHNGSCTEQNCPCCRAKGQCTSRCFCDKKCEQFQYLITTGDCSHFARPTKAERL